MAKSGDVRSTQSFPGLTSVWSGQSTRGRVRSQPNHTTTRTTKRTHSADARPQYQRSCLTLFNGPKESRLIGNPSAVYREVQAPPGDRQHREWEKHQDAAPGSYRGRSLSPSRDRGNMHISSTRGNSYDRRILQSDKDLRPFEHDFDHLRNSLIMFGDAYADQVSVYTGLSQQELIQKERHDQSTRKRKEKRYEKKKIVDIPPGLLSSRSREDGHTSNGAFPSGTMPMHKYVCSPGAIEIRDEHDNSLPLAKRGLRNYVGSKNQSMVHPTAKGRPSKRWNIIPSLAGSRSHSDGSTVNSSYESASGGILDPPSRSNPSQDSDALRWLQSASESTRSSNHGNQSKGMPKKQLFPLTSTNTPDNFGEIENPLQPRERRQISHYASGDRELNVALDDVTSRTHMSQKSKVVEEKSDTRQAMKPSLRAPQSGMLNDLAGDERLTISQKFSRVRFAQHIDTAQKQSTQSHVKVSPTSVMDLHPTINWSPTEQIRHSDDSQRSDTRQPIVDARPQSKLRKGRFQSERPSHENLPRTKNGKIVRISTAPVVASEFISSSPSATGFLDGSRATHYLARSENVKDFDVAPMEGDLMKMQDWVCDDDSFTPNNPEVYRKNDEHNSLAPNNPEEYPKEVDEEDRGDDSSTVISDVYSEFIEAVASVVVQTAARQFLAKLRVRNIRDAKSALQQQEKISPTESVSRKGDVSELGFNDSIERNKSHEKPVNIFVDSATLIQSVFRGWFVRDSLNIDHYCATSIQRIFRGFRCRTNFEFDLFRIEIVQSVFRRALARRVAATRCASIVTIQAAVRGSLVRREMGVMAQHLSLEHSRAATMIQAQWRSFADEMNFLRVYECIIIIQSAVRGWIARRRVLYRQREYKETSSLKSFRKPVHVVKPSKYGVEKASRARSIHDFSVENATKPDAKTWVQKRWQPMGVNSGRDQEKLRSYSFAIQGARVVTESRHSGEFASQASNEEIEKFNTKKTVPIFPDERKSHNNLESAQGTDIQNELYGEERKSMPLLVREEEEKCAWDKAEQLRKERIAYHCTPDTAELRRERILRSMKYRELSESRSGSSESDYEKEISSPVSRNEVRKTHASDSRSRQPDQQSNAGFSEVRQESLDDDSVRHKTRSWQGTKQNGRAQVQKEIHKKPPLFKQRTEEEQRRIDKMHEAFRRVGLMA